MAELLLKVELDMRRIQFPAEMAPPSPPTLFDSKLQLWIVLVARGPA